jgi:hypothetical protein
MALTTFMAAGQTYDLVADFSTNSNPNGVWSYRYKSGDVRDGNYDLLSAYGPADGTWSPVVPGAWSLTGAGGVPEVALNQTGSDVDYNTGFVWRNGTTLVHPGNIALVIISWQSPSSMLVDINFSFTSLDTNGGNGIAWYVEKNNFTNTLSWGTYPDGGTSGAQALTAIPVSVGDRINFIVDPNGDYGYDSTQLTATINAHPAAQSYDVAADFSAANNPNGPWSYGYSLTLGGQLILYTNSWALSGLNIWLYDISSYTPSAYLNPTTNAIVLPGRTYGPGAFGLHPGPDGEYSVARFTAPATGQYHLTGSFFGQDSSPTTTDVHILTNSVAALDGEVTGFGPGTGPSFDIEVALNAGDDLDFAVGYGTDSQFGADSTGLSAQIVALVPPVIITQPSNQTVLAGETLTLTVNAAGPSPFGYQWQFNATNLPGATNATLTLAHVSPSQAGLYAVVVTNSYGMTVSSNAVLTILLPSLQISGGPGTILLWWPTNAAGFVLESAPGLGAGHAWTAFPGPINVFGDQYVVAADASLGARYFRLHRKF